MTDYSVNIPRGAQIRRGQSEYRLYFALIFLLALPFAVGGWILSPLLKSPRRSGSPFARAMAEARLITPMIFRA
jgi:PufQ cytochrome subunit